MIYSYGDFLTLADAREAMRQDTILLAQQHGLEIVDFSESDNILKYL